MKTPLTHLLNSLKQTTSVLAGLSIAATSVWSVSAPVQAVPRPIDQTVNAKTVALAQASSLPNGVYLYGQSAKPQQIGQAYFVFEVRQGKVVGALYMPMSSFDCAFGALDAEKVSLTVIDSYDRSENPYAIALDRSGSVANRANPAIAPVGLEGFHRLENISTNDQRILDVCKANYQKRVWN
jgi:hypothetical protein